MLSQLIGTVDETRIQDNLIKNERISNDIKLAQSQLKEVIRENVTQLVKYIFPITCEGLNRFIIKFFQIG